mmetsp:Transcript_90573/g.282017  ORF Transcript_90573/g.282017 Transcript_90573/m.282017 type:complete len:506 (+) Transcript_90573:2-1519(+)
MVDFQMTRKSINDELRKLRRYLRETHVPHTLAVCVIQQARQRCGQQENIQEKEVRSLLKISTSLLTELRCEIFTPHLECHPVFRLLISCDLSFSRLLCMEAVESVLLLDKDDLFCAGTTTDKAFFLSRGAMEYAQEPDTSPVRFAVTFPVENGTWLAEASLWSHWTHVGTAKSKKACQAVAVSAAGLAASLQRASDLREVVSEYCQQFHRRLVAAQPPRSSWPDYLCVPQTEYTDMVLSMRGEVQVAIGLCSLECQTGTHARSPASGVSSMRRASTKRHARSELDGLKREVKAGTSLVVLAADGQLARVVSVVALRLESECNKILVELGKIHDRSGAIKVSCALPACKKGQHETHEETLQRLLNSLNLLDRSEQVREVERTVECWKSKEFSVQTKYLRTLNMLYLHEEDLKLPTIKATSQIMHHLSSLSVMEPVKHQTGNGWATSKVELKELAAYTAFGVDKTVLYAWLSPAAFEFLSTTAAGEKELQEWLQALQSAEEPGTIGV